MQKFSRQITADDFEIGEKMMVSKSHSKPVADAQAVMGLMVQGAVIEIKSLNLPFLLAAAYCPMRGQMNVLVDIRDHEFIRVNSEFADAVLASATASQESSAGEEIPI